MHPRNTVFFKVFQFFFSVKNRWRVITYNGNLNVVHVFALDYFGELIKKLRL